jgi:hypothetical protein
LSLKLLPSYPPRILPRLLLIANPYKEGGFSLLRPTRASPGAGGCGASGLAAILPHSGRSGFRHVPRCQPTRARGLLPSLQSGSPKPRLHILPPPDRAIIFGEQILASRIMIVGYPRQHSFFLFKGAGSADAAGVARTVRTLALLRRWRFRAITPLLRI